MKRKRFKEQNDFWKEQFRQLSELEKKREKISKREMTRKKREKKRERKWNER